MKLQLVQWGNELPKSASALARSRTQDMIILYGRNITSMSIESLAHSCYLQGVRDAFEYHQQKQTVHENPNLLEARE